jgi:Ca2+-binding RTX toxin-like protein
LKEATVPGKATLTLLSAAALALLAYTPATGFDLRDIVGTNGNDHLVGTPERDRIRGLAGQDFLEGRAGNDILRGGPGDDALAGNREEDTLIGRAGDDDLWGGFGSDAMYGRSGEDKAFGGRGRDFFNSGGGDDIFFAGKGRDEAVISVSEATGRDFVHLGPARDAMLIDDDGDRDRIRCGRGRDVLEYFFHIDPKDVRTGCERVEVFDPT